MRLRLNTTLRAALIAAVSTFALATTAANASTGSATFGDTVTLKRGDEVFTGLYVKKDMTTGTATSNALTLDSAVNIYGGNFYAKDYTVSIWVTKDSLDSNQLLFAYGANNPAASISANGIYWNAQDKTITIGRGNVANEYSSMNWNGSDYKTSSSLASYLGDGDMVNFTIAVSGGDQSQTPTVWVNGVSQWTADAKYAGNMNNSVNPMKLYVSTAPTYGNITVTDAKLTDAADIYALMGVSTTVPSPSTDYIWTGNASNVWDTEALNWKTSESETPVAFVPGEDNTVTFNSTGTQKTVSLAADTTIGSVTVDGAAYTLDLDGHTLTTGTLAVKNTDASIALTGTGTVNASTISAQDKTISLDQGVVLTGEGAAKLSGTGTYALASGTKALGSVSLNDDWTGYVRIGGVAFSNDNLDSMARSGASGIEMAGITGGYVNGWNGGTVHAKVRLTNPSGSNDNIAWKWSDGTTADKDGNYPTITFDGAWDGSGTLQLTDKRQCFTYSGDISNWNGAFDYRGNHGTKLTFTGNATTVNVAILNNGTNDANKVWKQFHLIVDNNATFNKEAGAYTLEVTAGHSATFSQAISIASDITVGTGATLNVNGGGSIAKAITNNGTLTFGSDITATGLEVHGGSTGYVDVNGKTDSGNGFVTTTGDYIVIATNAQGATLTANDHKVTQNEVAYAIQADGTAVAAGGGVEYSTYFQTNGEVSVSEIQAAADKEHEVCMTAVVSDTGILNVDEGLGFISASGGEVNFIGEAAADMFFVTGDTKVSGLKDISIMSIEAGKSATMEDGLATGNVTFAATDGVKVTNTGEVEAITYSLEQTDAKVTADTMTVGNADTQTEINNSLVVGEITNNNAEGLLLNGNVADGVTLNAAAGDITMVGQTSNTLSVVDLTIAAGKTVELIDGDQTEGTITVTDTLTGGNATLLANLTLVGGSTLDVDGGDTNALTLGSTLTIDLTNGKFVNLDEDTIAALNDLANGESLALIKTGQVDLEYAEDYNGVWYDNMFVRAEGLVGDYQVYANAGSFGLTKSSQVPEPTTGTLSLLALAALAARRRRK